MAEIVYTDNYVRRAKEFVKKQPGLVSQYEKTLNLPEFNPYHPSLRLNKLSGKLSELCSISINISYRISIYFLKEKDKIITVDVGSHDEMY